MSLIVHQQTMPAMPGGKGWATLGRNSAAAMVSQLAWAVAGPVATTGTPAPSQQGPAGRLSYFASKKRRTKQAKATSGKANYKPLAKTIRDLAKIQSATHYCILHSEEGQFAGMYLPSPIQKQTAKNLHSLALTFSQMLTALHSAGRLASASGILCLGTTLSQTQMAFVAIEDGHITVDAVYDQAFAKEAINTRWASAPQLPVFFGLANRARNGTRLS